ncbi:conserved protein of unknown function [Limnospira indica PCC 8005]|uniref:Uncharacterized protein n=1 Tax=Limnospira indica PCC 8005 TaxID=376219 RepID=A0A9P1KIH7_9CYAN|nr:conserved protein of unknown function [Limnospira indica PCC 8005]
MLAFDGIESGMINAMVDELIDQNSSLELLSKFACRRTDKLSIKQFLRFHNGFT